MVVEVLVVVGVVGRLRNVLRKWTQRTERLFTGLNLGMRDLIQVLWCAKRMQPQAWYVHVVGV